MHESRLVAELVEEASRRAGDERIESISLHVGALAAVSAAGLRHGVAGCAKDRLGYSPSLKLTWGDDPLDPGAQGVTLRSISVGGG